MCSLKNKIYSYKEFFIVLSCILLSKSLYYESYGNNLLLGVFLVFLFFSYKPTSIKINKWVILYCLFFIILVSLNSESNPRSLLVLLLRLSIAVYVVHILDFKQFSLIFNKIILFLILVSLFSVLVIYFNIPSPLPDFVAIDGRPLRNFIFFGVWESTIFHSVYRNSGIFWEPGAFQIFINLAFIFSIVNNTMSIKRYFVFLFGIVSTVSTTGVIAFILLSPVFWFSIINKSRFKALYIGAASLFIVISFSFILPFILTKFSGGESGEASVSFLSRYYDFVISLNIFYDNFSLGYGFGSQVKNAITYGREFFGVLEYERVRPSGADGLTMFLAQCGVFSVILLFPFLFPKYYRGHGILTRLIITASLIIIFNTENFTFILIFSLLSLYGIVGNKGYLLKNQRSSILNY